MASEAAHLVDPYAYAVLLACANQDRTRSRIYVSNTQRRRFGEMLDAGWLRMDGKYVRTTESGIDAMHLMRQLLDMLRDDAWEGLIEDIDEQRERQGAHMAEHMLEKRKAHDTERREGL